MSFFKPKIRVDEGDTVIVFLNVKTIHAIEAVAEISNKKGEKVDYIFQTCFGALKVRKIIGVNYGSKIELSKGWAYILQPNPELWTKTLPHRTQIIYTPDISVILYQLNLHPGSIVIECGTGSGSLSHYFIRAIKPHGYLHTFDFHKARADQANEDFKRHGLSNYVTVYHKDVCQLGFGNDLNNTADVVFLDLPCPQDVIPHAVNTLKAKGGRFCSFSPCIEQSQNCYNTLQKHGFIEIRCMEILQQESIVKTRTLPVMPLDFLHHKKTEKCEEMGPKCTKKQIVKVLTALSPSTQPGHTGFLTFATLPPTQIW